MTTALDSHAKQMRQALWTMVRRRVPERDAEDVVQSVLAEAIASPHRPEEPESARRWIWGMARNKIADYHRRARRETFVEVEASVTPNDDSGREILEWAAVELPPGLDERRTFEWLLREGEGDRLDSLPDFHPSCRIPLEQAVRTHRA
jgi:DNA-directed RNA polymerase specialized sigma24 family protein